MIIGCKILYQFFIKSGDIKYILELVYIYEMIENIEDKSILKDYEDYVLKDMRRI